MIGTVNIKKIYFIDSYGMLFFYSVAIINANWKNFTPHRLRCKMQNCCVCKICVQKVFLFCFVLEHYYLIVFKLIKLICELLHVDYLFKTVALQ